MEMEKNEQARELVRKYNIGRLTAAEELQLERFIEMGLVKLDELDDLRELDHQLDYLFADELSREMRHGFREMLQEEKERQEGRLAGIRNLFNRLFVPAGGFNFAYGLLFLLIGAGAGLLMQPRDNNREISRLSDELKDMREAMMLTLLRKESTSDRLKAVNLTQDMNQVSDQVAEALLRTLEEDPNVNVRLAALEALYPYAFNPAVRQGLINAIVKQESPLVQMALAEVMVALQERRSVEEFRRLMDREQTPPEVREKIRQSIEILM